jgi:phosphate starvation-inducible PhoH-like protein
VSTDLSTSKFHLHSPELLADLLGPGDANLELIERAFPNTIISVTNDVVNMAGPDCEVISLVLDQLIVMLDKGSHLTASDVAHVITQVVSPSSRQARGAVLKTTSGKRIRPSTPGQERYTEAIATSTVTFGMGPAGTGKSYLAVAAAVAALQSNKVRRIILTRPAVEAGERLGFLPGDLVAKVDPYLKPLYDALYDMLGAEQAQRLIERNVIEIAPLAFMRGRTLSEAFIILDEAQNTTPEQMKMFLTRIGFGSKAVITGDVTQIDLANKRSGLCGIEKILAGVDQVSFVELGKADVVRHRVVADIIDAYERAEAAQAAAKKARTDTRD